MNSSVASEQSTRSLTSGKNNNNPVTKCGMNCEVQPRFLVLLGKNTNFFTFRSSSTGKGGRPQRRGSIRSVGMSHTRPVTHRI
ncbi:hypothetical protein CEXT_67141 [Caerostris extrusa]|uniref:Ycf15 n=1 Tax=Caerostris extrusa TaxID=172846 RepID=A0AAV4XXE8_CAEEX|nr:hypothetical protein CEXT_67141 [Caerostris extrusa]